MNHAEHITATERHPDWQARLGAYLADVAGRPFRAGRLDCALFAAGAVEAMTGQDHAALWRGKYKSLKAGNALLQEQGWADHVAVVASLFPETPTAYAQTGDIAVLPADRRGAALGIVQGAGVYALSPAGLSIVSRLHAQRAFTV